MNSNDEEKIIGQTEPVKNDKAIRQVSIDAKISLWTAIIAWGLILILILASIANSYISFSSSIHGELVGVMAELAILSSLISILFGLLSIWRIRCRKNELYGTGRAIIGILLSIAFLMIVIAPALQRARRVSMRTLSAGNEINLVNAIILYAGYNNNNYPDPDHWCDLLIQDCNVDKKEFICRTGVQNGNEGPCHYGINPNCEANSTGDTVLLFETKRGWNQHGGPELLTFEHHGGIGCYIAFNGGKVEFVRPKDVGKLKWKSEDSNNLK